MGRRPDDLGLLRPGRKPPLSHAYAWFASAVLPMRNVGLILLAAYGAWVVFAGRSVEFLGKPSADDHHGHAADPGHAADHGHRRGPRPPLARAFPVPSKAAAPPAFSASSDKLTDPV
ncbi:MAG: hypothetical protein IPL96_17730 [Holophagaceae bacterium]|nr:hypothetical protein [Holophagaceae bacterium]